MAQKITKVYENAVAQGLLPGVAVLAGDKDGNIVYSKSLGKTSLKAGRDDPFTESTICAIASMSKLMTSVAALQAVETGQLALDQDVRALLPEMGQYGVITGFDDSTNTATLAPDSTPITLRMLLSHTSGHEYDWLSPDLGKWRASRNEGMWHGPTVQDKSALPLVFPPGTGFAYGGGHDWAGKLVEIASSMKLEERMLERIWKPLGIEGDISFYPKTNPDMERRMADIATLNDKGDIPAVDAPFFDILFGGTDCFGGGGLFSSAKAYYTFLSAILRRDPRLLKPESYEELFRPQLDEELEEAFNKYLVLSPAHTAFLRLGVPPSVRMTWSFAGMMAKESYPGRFGKGTHMWAGVPSVVWWIDHEAGNCGVAMDQIIPPLHPPVVALHEEFQKGVWEISKE